MGEFEQKLRSIETSILLMDDDEIVANLDETKLIKE